MSPFRNITFLVTNVDRFSATCGGSEAVPFGLQVSADKKVEIIFFLVLL